MNPQSVSLMLVLASLLPADEGSQKLAGQARTILQKHCVQCHGDGKELKAGFKVFDYKQLVNSNRPLVVKNKPDESALIQLIDCGSMPPGTAAKVPIADRNLLREWVAAGAADFPSRSGEAVILTLIQADVNKLPAGDRAHVRYLSLNHLLDDPDAAKDLDVYRAALSRAINLVSTKEPIVAPVAIDADNTIFRIRIDELGWDKRPFVGDPKNTQTDVDPTRVNLYDLVLLEYPFAPPADLGALVTSYLKPANLLRPIPYVRGDWFAAAVTDWPLYGELLQLPATFRDLEKQLGVKAAPVGRAGLTESKYLRGNRILERNASDKVVYWRTYDLEGPPALDALVKVAGDDPPDHAGGEAVFSLPNGLPGFFVGDAKDRRLAEIAPKLLNDKAAAGVRAGLACIRCHTAGVQPFEDVVNKNANLSKDAVKLRELFPPLADAVTTDNRRFAAAFAKLRTAPGGDPLDFVARKAGSNSGTMPALDGLQLQNHEPADSPVKVTLTILNKETGKPTKVFRPGQTMTIVLTNVGSVKVYYELMATNFEGVKIPFEFGELKPDGDSFSRPLRVGDEPGKEHLTVYAAESKLPAPVLLRTPGAKDPLRIVHPVYRIEGDNQAITPLIDPARVVKKTVPSETVVDKDK